MSTRASTRYLALVGVVLAVAGVGAFLWYNTAVLGGDEINRLEAGGASTSTTFEFLVLLGSPVLFISGLGLIGYAWLRWQRRAQRPDRADSRLDHDRVAHP